MIYRPIVLDEEIKFSKKKVIESKTDMNGNIIYVNNHFSDISGYTAQELIGEPHNVLRHPDMPRAIFFLIWSSLLTGKEVSAVVKNLAKSGQYYWLLADFSIKRDQFGQLIELTSVRRVAPCCAKECMEELYEGMLQAERKSGMKGSLVFLEKFLEEKGMTYDQYLEDILTPKGFFPSIVSKVVGSF